MPTGEEEYRGIRMKVLCVVGCVKSGRFYRKKKKELLSEVLPHEDGHLGWRQSQGAPWGLNVQGCP